MPGAARQNDKTSGLDIHIVMIPTPGGDVPVPLPHPFSGKITSGVSTNVKINGQGAAMAGAAVENNPKHVAFGPKFQKNPTNKGKILLGNPTVLINGKMAAVQGSLVMECADPMDMPTGQIAAGSPNVKIGG